MKQHPDDSRLVSLVDGELTPEVAAETRSHLEKCWRCRTRLQAFEEQIASVARVFDAAAFADPRWIDRGLVRLGVRAEQTHQPRSLIRGISGFAFASLVAASTALWFQAPRNAEPRPQSAVSVPASKAVAHPVVSVPKAAAAPALPTPAPAPVVLEARIDLDQAEVAARYALFRIGADLGDPVEIERVNGRIVVGGVIALEERRMAVIGALRGIPGVAAEFDAPTGASPIPIPASAEVVVGRPPEVESELRQFLAGGQRNALEFGGVLIQRASRAVDHAWALRRLEEGFPPVKREALDSTSRDILMEMAFAHLAAVSSEMSAFGAEARPFFERAGVASAGTERAPLFQLVESLHRNTLSLFAAVSASEHSDPKARMIQILSCLEHLGPALSRTEQQWKTQGAGPRKEP